MSKKENNEKCCGGLHQKNFRYILLGIAILTLVNTFALLGLTGKVNTVMAGCVVEAGSDVKPVDDSQPPGNQQPSGSQISVDDDDVKGSANAPVTIVEFSDYECPFCARFFDQTLPEIQKNYIDTGKVKLVFRDFPLSFHQNAQKAAEAAECAGEQGKYWEMHDKLFGEGVSGGVGLFKQYAADLGLDTEEFNTCLDSGQMASEVQKDFRDGQAYGVTGTPGFFINGVKVVGAQPYSVFEQVIEQELNK